MAGLVRRSLGEGGSRRYARRAGRRLRRSAAILAALSACAGPPPPSVPARTGAPTDRAFISRLDGTEQRYLLAVPAGPPRALVLYLHGHGSDRRQGMDRGAYGGAFGRLMDELGRRGFAYATLDYRGTTSWMSEAAEADVTQAIDLLKSRLGVSKVYLAGASMGGSSALAYAVRHPDRVDGVLAICGTSDIGDFHGWCRTTPEPPVLKELADAIEAAYCGTPAAKPDLYAGRNVLANAARLRMPVVLAHGENDAVIPVRYSRDLRRVLDAQGARALYCEYPAGGHDTPLVEADWSAWLDFVAARQGPSGPLNDK